MLQFRLLLVKVRQACFESQQTSIKAVLTTCGVAWVGHRINLGGE